MSHHKMNYYYDITVLKFKSVIRKNLSINFLDKLTVHKLFVKLLKVPLENYVQIGKTNTIFFPVF